MKYKGIRVKNKLLLIYASSFAGLLMKDKGIIMKIDRLIGILSILLQQEKVTAPYLAEKFEVSRRTINRDIEDICKAGVPLVTTQGKNGGISIMDGYKMNRALLTSGDMQALLAGLRSLDSVSQTNKYQQLMEKLSVGNSGILSDNSHILIDLSSWYKTDLAPKIELLQTAIERRELVKFVYYGPRGDGDRKMEPYLLVFHWASWYIWGYCRQRKDYRMFKLNRLLSLKNTAEKFVPREFPPLQLENERIFPPSIWLEALIEPACKWRLIEEYGIDSFQEQEDGKLLFRFGFMDKESAFSWILTFGAQAELLKPANMREELAERLRVMGEKYS